MTKSSKKIAIVTSTRADWGLLFPLVKELKERTHTNDADVNIETVIIATYMHLFPEMGDTISELVADGYPPTMSVPARVEPPEAVADTVTGFSKAFRFLKPDIIVILGDRFEMLGVATAALLQNIPIAHIAGGTISEGAYDNAIRNAISQMASLHFPETDQGRRRIINMGANPDNVITSGALGVYNSLNASLLTRDELEKSIGFQAGDRYLLGTFHPATISAIAPPQQMQIWLDGLKGALDKDPDLKILLTFPNTDSEPNQLLSLMYTFATPYRERVKIVDSLGRIRYLSAASSAAVVAGNSSSGIVEIPSLGIPVINVGNRQKGRLCSEAVTHVPLEAQRITDAILNALTPEATAKAKSASNPYFMEGTPAIIADNIISFIHHKP